MESTSNINAASTKQNLCIGFTDALQYDTSMELVSSVLDGEEKKTIAHAPWKAFPYQPDVRFSMMHSGDCLFLKFYVEEKTVVAAHSTTHSAVYKDSCVEFFVCFDDKGYYNFEFNCTGTVLAAFGSSLEQRSFLPEATVHRIRRLAMIQKEAQYKGAIWTLTVAIPLDVFVSHRLTSLKKVECRANFYKCGDDLPEPHFLAWANIETQKPDFHQPRYFGTLVFE